jgi:hypothetical protein
MSKIIKSKAVILNNKVAKYYNKFHNIEKEDHINKVLESTFNNIIIEKKIDPSTVNKPFNNEEFKFKYDSVKCIDNKRQCLLDECYFKDAVITIKITPYDFVKDKKNIVGITIKLLEVNII